MDILKVINIALKAGNAVMQIYKQDFIIEYKDDKSPLTTADKTAHQIINDGLSEISYFPILSEEGKKFSYEERKNWQYYWLIDPIDGTKEFIKKNGEFTVNIALIHKDTPVLGVVFAPAVNELYYAKKGEGAYKIVLNDEYSALSEVDLKTAGKLPLKSQSSNAKNSSLTIVASKSHLNRETQEFIDNLTSDIKDYTLISKGSSLKLLMVAQGSADIYPRLAPTMEWDTAAADVIVRESGKMTYRYIDNTEKEPMKYNKEDLRNPWFVVR